MKAELVPPVPEIIRDVQITMTMDEARLLKWMSGLNATIPRAMESASPYSANETVLFLGRLCSILYPFTGL